MNEETKSEKKPGPTLTAKITVRGCMLLGAGCLVASIPLKSWQGLFAGFGFWAIAIILIVLYSTIDIAGQAFGKKVVEARKAIVEVLNECIDRLHMSKPVDDSSNHPTIEKAREVIAKIKI